MFEFIVALIICSIAMVFIYILLYASIRDFRRWSKMPPEERRLEREQKLAEADRQLEERRSARRERMRNIPRDNGGDEYLFDD